MPLLKTIGTMSLISTLSRGAYSTGNFAIISDEDFNNNPYYIDAGGSDSTMLKNKPSFIQTSFGSVGFTQVGRTVDSQSVQELNLFIDNGTTVTRYFLKNENITYQQPNTGNSYCVNILGHVYNDYLYLSLRMKQVGASQTYYNLLAFKYQLTGTSITQVWGNNVYVGEGVGTGVSALFANYNQITDRFQVNIPPCATINGSTIGVPLQVRFDGTFGYIAGSSGYSSTTQYPNWVTLVNSGVGYDVSTVRRTNGTITYKHTWTPTLSDASVTFITTSNDGYVYFKTTSGVYKWNPLTNTASAQTISFASLYTNSVTTWRMAVDDTHIYILAPALNAGSTYFGIFKFTKTFTFVKSMRIDVSNASIYYLPRLHISVVGSKLYVSGESIVMTFNKDLTIVPPGQFTVYNAIYQSTYTYSLTSTITPTLSPLSVAVSSAVDSLPSGSSASSIDTNPSFTLLNLPIATKAT